jgi:hypothetical protein
MSQAKPVPQFLSIKNADNLIQRVLYYFYRFARLSIPLDERLTVLRESICLLRDG